ncbi:hypothetical protein IFR05_010485 [Cadophora sp. M221]|nr:hypothetical protein IFR05_010485 [Cadophora sp. M221]
MDPVTILSLVCNICQLCEYGVAALVMAKEVYCSERGLAEQHERLQSSTKSLEGLSGRLEVIKQGPLRTDDEKNLQDLAADCKEISCKILGLLEKIKGKNGHSLVSAMAVTVRDMRYRGKIEELQEELRHLQDQVHLQLSVVLRSEVLERLEALIKSRNSDASELAALRENIQILRAGVKATELGDEVSSQLLHLLNISSEGIDCKCRDYLLKAISFSTMNKRYDQVDVAHEATFKWILEQDKLEVDERFRRHKIEVGLRSWLSRSSGIFQIIAKPGAGKSTMMKVICDSPETRKLLQEWAGAKRIIMAKFFFWKQGHPMQRSMDGMIRSLLYQILSEAPELIAACFPNQWRAIRNTPWHSQLTPELLNTKLRPVFTRLLADNNSKIFDTSNICIVLDGLDEFEGPRGNEELVDLIQHLAGLSENIKICVSSRVMNSLAPIYEAYPSHRIYLHDLTKADAEKLVRDRLNSHQSFAKMTLEHNDESEEFMSEIVEKAEGVFLWVILILNELCRGLTDGDTLSDLWETVEACPEDLDKFLRKIISSIPARAQKMAYRTFAVVAMLSRCDRNMRLLNYSFLEDYNSNGKFALSIPPGSNFSVDETESRLARTRKRLTAHCKELLHVDDAPHGPNAPLVSFVHRSVREIFEQEQVKNDMAEHIKDFDVLDAILQTHLAGVKHEPDCNFDMITIKGNIGAIRNLLTVVNVVQPRCTTATCESLDRLSTSVMHRQGIVAKSFYEVEWRKREVIDEWYELKSKRKYTLSLVHIAAQIGLWTYLDWTVNRFPDFAKYHEAAAELLWKCVWARSELHFWPWSAESCRWVESLLRRGLSANCPWYSVSEDEQLPIWYGMLSDFLNESATFADNGFWRSFEIFVRYGAECSITMERTTGQEVLYKTPQVRFAGWKIHLKYIRRGLQDLLGHPVGGRVLELQDIVDYYAPKNAATIKDLIIRNQARERESPSIVTLSNQDFEEAWRAADKAGKDVTEVKFRMREANWDVSPPTSAELETEKFEKWAAVWEVLSPTIAGLQATAVENRGTSGLSLDSFTFKPKEVSVLAPEQASPTPRIVSFGILGLPVLVLALTTYPILLLPRLWLYLFGLDSNLRELWTGLISGERVSG